MRWNTIMQSDAYKASLIGIMAFSLLVAIYAPTVAQAATVCDQTVNKIQTHVRCFANDDFPISTTYCGVTDTFAVTSVVRTNMIISDNKMHLTIVQSTTWKDSSGTIVGNEQNNFVSNIKIDLPSTIHSNSNVNCANGGQDSHINWGFQINKAGELVNFHMKST